MCQGVIPYFFVNNVDMALPIFCLIAKCTHIVNNVNIGGNVTLRSCFKSHGSFDTFIPHDEY